MKLKFRMNSATIWECLMLIIDLAGSESIDTEIVFISKVMKELNIL